MFEIHKIYKIINKRNESGAPFVQIDFPKILRGKCTFNNEAFFAIILVMTLIKSRHSIKIQFKVSK